MRAFFINSFTSFITSILFPFFNFHSSHSSKCNFKLSVKWNYSKRVKKSIELTTWSEAKSNITSRDVMYEWWVMQWSNKSCILTATHKLYFFFTRHLSRLCTLVSLLLPVEWMFLWGTTPETDDHIVWIVKPFRRAYVSFVQRHDCALPYTVCV